MNFDVIFVSMKSFQSPEPSTIEILVLGMKLGKIGKLWVKCMKNKAFEGYVRKN